MVIKDFNDLKVLKDNRQNKEKELLRQLFFNEILKISE